MATWRFGEILSNGFSNEEQQGFSEVTPDAGNPYRRQEFTDIQDLISGTFILDFNEYLDFKNWYRNEIRQGSLSFDYYDCRVDQSRTARIIGKPQYTTVSNQYRLSITLSLESVTVEVIDNLVSEAGDQIISEGGDNIITTTKYKI